jgi:hypothetical protein
MHSRLHHLVYLTPHCGLGQVDVDTGDEDEDEAVAEARLAEACARLAKPPPVRGARDRTSSALPKVPRKAKGQGSQRKASSQPAVRYVISVSMLGPDLLCTACRPGTAYSCHLESRCDHRFVPGQQPVCASSINLLSRQDMKKH